jgi:hypothetical protein
LGREKILRTALVCVNFKGSRAALKWGMPRETPIRLFTLFEALKKMLDSIFDNIFGAKAEESGFE